MRPSPGCSPSASHGMRPACPSVTEPLHCVAVHGRYRGHACYPPISGPGYVKRRMSADGHLRAAWDHPKIFRHDRGPPRWGNGRTRMTWSQSRPRNDRVICVMCGTRLGRMGQDADAARELGRSLAELSLTVLYGGGGTGLMGALADGVLAGGGCVEGVMPRALLDYGIEHQGLCRLRVVPGLAEQQAVMLERSEGFIG